jgi:outer membrane protein OmpU
MHNFSLFRSNNNGAVCLWAILAVAALLTALLIGATGARAAEEAKPVGLSVGGFFTQGLGMVDINDDRLEEEVLLENAEIHFRGKTILDSGTEIGFRVELEAYTKDDQIDETYFYAKGNWGKIILGAENGVAYLAGVHGPRFVPGIDMTNNDLMADAMAGAVNAMFRTRYLVGDAHMSPRLEHITGDAPKISYFTPKLAGVQVGVSYTPNNKERNGGASNFTDFDGSEQREIYEYSMTYDAALGSGRIEIGASGVETHRGTGDKPQSRSLGLKYSLGDWSIGGSRAIFNHLDMVDTRYEHDAKDNNRGTDAREIDRANYTVSYRLSDDSRVGLGFTRSDETSPLAAQVSQYREYMLGGGTRIAPGVSIGYFGQDVEMKRPGVTSGSKREEFQVLGLTLDLKF